MAVPTLRFLDTLLFREGWADTAIGTQSFTDVQVIPEATEVCRLWYNTKVNQLDSMWKD